jgi:hypothetical protein
MTIKKCNKYLYKLLNTNTNDTKFSLYLTKLNYWYEKSQIGGFSIIKPKIKPLKCNENYEIINNECVKTPKIITIKPKGVGNVQKEYIMTENIYTNNKDKIKSTCRERINKEDCINFPSILPYENEQMCYWNDNTDIKQKCDKIDINIVDECNASKSGKNKNCTYVNSIPIILN